MLQPRCRAGLRFPRRVAPMLLSSLLAAALFFSETPAPAQSIESRKVEGLFIYKRHAFLDDASAEALEYTSILNFPAVTYLQTAAGNRYRLVADQVPYVLPYPGRGGITKDQALILIDLMLSRFPQYKQLLENIRTGWEESSPTEAAEQAEISAKRNNALATSMEATYQASQFHGQQNTNHTALDSPTPASAVAVSDTNAPSDDGSAETVTGTDAPTADETAALAKILKELTKSGTVSP